MASSSWRKPTEAVKLAGKQSGRGSAQISENSFKGAADADLATASGQLQLTFINPAGALPFLERGRIRPLAVTSATRLSLLSSVPILDESGLPGFDYSAWYGVSAPEEFAALIRREIEQTTKLIEQTGMKAE